MKTSQCLNDAELFWYRHGELSARERREIAWHLALCQDCRKQYADKTRMAVGLASSLALSGQPARAFPLHTLSPARTLTGFTCIAVIMLAFLRVYSVTAGPRDTAPVPEPVAAAEGRKALSHLPSSPFAALCGKRGEAPFDPARCRVEHKKE